MRLRPVLIVFVIAFVLRFVCAQIIPVRPTTLIPKWEDWIPILAIAISIAYILAALGYAIGQIFAIPEAIAWAKGELTEANATVFIVAILFIAIAAMNALYDAYYCPAATEVCGPMDVSLGFLSDISRNLFDIWFAVARTEMALNVIMGPPLTIVSPELARAGSPVPKLGKKETEEQKPGAVKATGFITVNIGGVISLPFYGLGAFGELSTRTGVLLLGGFGIAIALQLLLEFIKNYSLAVILPFGIFLRAFTLTRRIGSTLIAVALCSYIFFPVSVLLIESVNKAAAPKPNIPTGWAPPGMPEIPQSLITPMFGPDFGHGFLDCDEWCVGVLIVFRPTCYILELILWIASLISASLALIVWLVSLNVTWCPQAYAAAYVVGTALGGLETLAAYNACIGNLATSLSEWVSHFTAAAMFHAAIILVAPAIIFIILVTAFRSLSPALGGELQILGLTSIL